MAKAIYDRAEKNRKQRELRAATGNACTIKYERSKPGKLMRTYRNMLSRVSGVLKLKAHLYEGKDILSKDEFYAWAEASPEFHRLYDAWVSSGYQCGESPSVDRINPDAGYTLENMEWVTHRENSRRGSARRHGLPVPAPKLIDRRERVVRDLPGADRQVENTVAPAGG